MGPVDWAAGPNLYYTLVISRIIRGVASWKPCTGIIVQPLLDLVGKFLFDSECRRFFHCQQQLLVEVIECQIGRQVEPIEAGVRPTLKG